MKRGFALSCVHSALAMTRRSRLQLLRVDQLNSLNRRAGLPLVLLSFFGLDELRRNRPRQTLVLRQAEDVVDTVCFAPRHHSLAGKARIGSQQDTHVRPGLANLPDNAGDFLHRTGRGVDVRAAQLGCQQLIAAEHIKRQIAVAIVVAVEEAAFLTAVQRIIGGVEIEDDLFRRLFMRLNEQIHQQLFDGRRIMSNLVIARRLRPAQLQTVERRLAGHRRTILAMGLKLAGQHRHHRIMAQLVVVVEILIASAIPNTRWPTSVSTRCSTSS